MIFLLLPVVVLAGTPEDNGPDVYTLPALYRLALERSEEIRIAGNNLWLAEKDKNRARSALLPRLSGFGNYIRYTESNPLQPESAYDYGARLQQQVTLNGREWTGYQAALDTIKQREYDLSATVEAYLFTVAAGFYDVVNKQNQVEILRANVRRLETYKISVEKRLQLEAVPRTDLLRTEAELSGTATELVGAENELAYARAALASLVDLPGGVGVQPPGQPPETSVKGRLTEFLRTAQNNRPEIKSAHTGVVLAEANVAIEKSAYWPVLSLEAGYKVENAEFDLIPGDDSEDESLYGAVNVELMVFDWGLRKATIGKARTERQNTRLRLESLKKQIALEVEQAHLNVIAAKEGIAALGDQLKFARANFDAITRQFELGQADSLDVMDANTLLLNSETELAEAQNRLALAYLDLQRAQGIFLKNIKTRYSLQEIPFHER